LTKYIFISGGVLSGLGKGITAASIALLLKSHGFKVTAMKCDMYLNIDAGTMNPMEHGEVFVTADGLETDQDLGHYERFLSTNLSKENYLTNGLVYKIILDKERALEYGGICVEPYHHIPPIILERWSNAAKKNKADIILVELGGTVGEYEGLLFFEAIRRLKVARPSDAILIHVGYLPAPPSIGELKSKPLQQSVMQLNSLGLRPDVIVARAEKTVDGKRKEKIALASGLEVGDIIANPDVKSIYEVPLVLDEQEVAEKILQKLKLKPRKKNLTEWKNFVKNFKSINREVKIGLIGKYQKTGDYTLEDSYVCVVEALKHAAWKNKVNPNLIWINSEDVETYDAKKMREVFAQFDGVIIPQGWGSRGTEGKIKSIQYIRENKIPYLGLCFGMQMGVVEFARHVAGLKDANSSEANVRTKYPVVDVMQEQKNLLAKRSYGGTIRLGQWACKVKSGSLLRKFYGQEVVQERHRHRYEVNNEYRATLEKAGMIFSGTSPDGKLVEAFELPQSVHPFFVGTQFHPEYQSWPLKPHPVFDGFIQALI
jgi:CTP synthase